METKREDMTMRALYLLAIVFVVDGHIPLQDLFDLGGLFGYYSFHLLLFTFGSGCLFRLHGTLSQDILHRARRTLLPLYAWNMAYGLLSMALRHFAGFTLGESLSPYTLFLAPVLDGQHFVWNLGAWFLFPLFLVQVIYAGLFRLSRWVGGDGRLLFVLCLLMGCFAVFRLRAGENQPLWLLRTLVLLPGYAGGALYTEWIRQRDTMPSLPYFMIIFLLRTLLILMVGRPNYLLSNGTYFGAGPLGVYAGGFLAIAFWLRVARILAPAVQNSPLALYLAQHTRDVMLHHYMGFFVVNCIFLLLNQTGIGAAEFSVASFRTQSGYVFAPGEPAAYAVLYLTAGLLLPLLIPKAWESLQRQILSYFRIS